MRQSKASRPSPVFILAVLALVAAFAGTAIAGPDAISNKVTKSKVKTIAKKQINKAAPGLSVAEAEKAEKAENAENLGGDPASAYLKTTGVRFVKIGSTGTIDGALSKGVTQANVSSPSTGRYCIDGLDPAPRSAQVTIDYAGPYEATEYVQINPTGAFCAGTQVYIATFVDPSTATNMPTYVALFD